ncbi:leukocyte-associated immunoglobulin-like receptor 1 isoform X3 [Apodemus sylvaticus]|uniref:leukocyte-associated immunoglobulin-like receptor 1 isoform X3 n=1 Tax=Apodemus sylvaticus TaxID=10129 RepID=UPI0022425743|nr:leukocyte-associated immunoglobulin-like receptor 1 isoform X3 [Apodemus sylvaticus]
MSRHPVILMMLVLFLGSKISTQKGSQPDPTIYAEPGPVITQGSFVTVVCSKSGDYNKVRLEKDGNIFKDKTSPNVTEDRFLIGPVNETMTGHYSCIYTNGNSWSSRSEKLELKVIKEPVTQAPVTQAPVTQVPVTQVPVTQVPVTQVPAPGPTVTSGLPDNKRQQQRPEERLKLATTGLEMTPVADNRLPEDRQTETRMPVARDLQEVTYAQLDHHSLTQRAVGAGTTQSTDIMAESITYADIGRR